MTIYDRVIAMKKHFISSIVFLMLVSLFMGKALAQSAEENVKVREFLDNMFEHLDKTKVPTGLLRDYAFELVDLDRYDGTSLTDSNFVEKPTFEYLLRSVRSSAVLDKPFKSVSSILDDMYEIDDGTIAIGLLLYKYNYIKSNALDDNLIRYENEQVYDSYDSSGNWRNPYGEKYVIGFSSYSLVTKGNQVTFSFPSELVFTNVPISKLEFDAGDGLGYRPVSIGGTLTIIYGEGECELKLRATLSTGEVLVCHGRMYSEGSHVGVTSEGSAVDQSPDVVQTFIYSGGEGQIKATASVFYASGNSNKTIKKPFIVVEGFDPMDLANYMVKTGSLSNSNSFYDRFGFTNAGNTLKDIACFMNDYDVIYVDWMNCEADIRDNAELLKKIIGWINEQKMACGSNDSNTVMGQSMGGLIVRYALRSMEMQNCKHEVTTFISHDVPHLGANIPVGMLYAVHSLLSFYYGGALAVDVLDYAVNAENWVKMVQKYLYSDSARQMLLNFVNENGQLDNSVHDEWQDEINALGFPLGDSDTGIMNFAVVNGGVHDLQSISSYLHASGDLHSGFFLDFLSILSGPIVCDLLGIESKFWDILPGRTNVTASIDVLPYFSPSSKVFDMQIVYRRKVLWLFNRTVTAFAAANYAPASDMTYDAFPGSYYSFDVRDNASGNDHVGWVGGYEYDITINDKFMFIPTASALCIGNGINPPSRQDYVRTYWPDIPQPLAEMPFQAVLAMSNASTHISHIDNMDEWLMQQMEIRIEGPSLPVTGDAYTLANCEYPVTWSVSDPSVAAIDASSGVITVKSPGVTTVTASYNYLEETISRSKTIMVGLPDFYLQVSHDGLISSVTAKCRTDGNAFKVFFDEGLIEYEWGIKDDDKPIEWTLQRDSVFVIGAPVTTRPRTVFMRVKTSNGLTGPVYNCTFSTPYPFIISPKFIVSNTAGELYTCSSFGIFKLLEDELPLTLVVKLSKLLDQQGINPGMPWRIIVNGEKIHRWDEYPGGQDVRIGMSFYLFDKEEFLEYKQQMKPWGDTEIKVFSILMQDNKLQDMMTAPVIFVYIEDFPENYDEFMMEKIYYKYF